MRIFLLLAGWLLLGLVRAAAQAPVADTLTYHPQGSVRNLSGAVVPGSGWLLLAETRHPKNADSTYLRQLWLDQHLHPVRRLELGLHGRHLYPEAVQPFGQRVLVRLSGRDTLRLLALDTLGRVVAQVREPLPRPRADYDLVLPELPGTPGVLTLQRWKGDAPWVLAYRGPDLRLRWQQRLTIRGVRLTMVADSTHLWLVLMRYPTHRHPVTTALCYSLRDGTELSRTQLGPTTSG